MNKILYALVAVLACTSCANTYNIEGSSNLSTLDGQKLYLKIFADDDMKNVDSCEVVHGKFAFTGTMDSTVWANIFMDQSFLVPVVLENGNIVIRIDNTQTTIGGTPQNDELNTFWKDYAQYANQLNEVSRANAQMLLNGMTEMEANTRSNAQFSQLLQKADKQFSTFISTNFNNAVGPCTFMYLVMTDPYIPSQDWVEALFSKASPTFMNDGFVKAYHSDLQHYQETLRNMAAGDGYQESPALPATPPMTPNEMAGDTASAK